MRKNYAKSIFLTVLLFLFGMAGTAVAQNLLTNGDMETWDGDTPTGWNRMKTGITVAKETSIVHGGAASAAVTVTGNKAETDFGQDQQIIVQAGKTYNFSVWSYHTEGNLFFAWVIGVAGGYNFSSSNGIHTDNTITGEWQEFTWQWDCTIDDTVDVFFRWYNQDGFDGEEVNYIDDAVVEEQAVAEELLTNPGFEDWSDGLPDGWDRMKTGISVAEETTIVHSGSSSAAVTQTGNKADTDFGQNHNVIVDSGTVYSFSIWAYHTEGTTFFAWVVGKAGGYNFSSSFGMHTDNTITGEWQNFKWQWDCQHDDTVDVFFRWYQQDGFDGEEITYLDDASMQVQTASTDATLSGITVEGASISDLIDGEFSPDTYWYEVFLPAGTTEVPAVDATTSDENAAVEVIPATDLAGDTAARTTTISVTAEDGFTKQDYEILFTVVTGIHAPGVINANIYPVPATDQITLSGLDQKVRKIEIMDITGKNVKWLLSSGSETRVDISDLNPGYYFLRVEEKTVKFIKR